MCRTAFFVLMVTTSVVMGVDDIDPFITTLESLNQNYFSSEAVEVAQELAVFMANLLEGLEDMVVKVKTQNYATDSLKNFENAENAAKATKCTFDVPKSYQDAEEIISSAADSCAYSVTVDDLGTVLPELAKVEKQIQALDGKLQKNPDKLEKTKIISELKSVFSPEVVVKLNKMVMLDVISALDKCIKDSTLALWTELDSSTKKIKDCLKKSK